MPRRDWQSAAIVFLCRSNRCLPGVCRWRHRPTEPADGASASIPTRRTRRPRVPRSSRGQGHGQERVRKRRPGALRPSLGIKGCAWAVARDDQMQAGIDAPTMLRHDQRVTLHTHGEREGGARKVQGRNPFFACACFLLKGGQQSERCARKKFSRHPRSTCVDTGSLPTASTASKTRLPRKWGPFVFLRPVFSRVYGWWTILGGFSGNGFSGFHGEPFSNQSFRR